MACEPGDYSPGCDDRGTGTPGEGENCGTGQVRDPISGQCVPLGGDSTGGDGNPGCPNGKPARRRGGSGQGSQDWVCYEGEAPSEDDDSRARGNQGGVGTPPPVPQAGGGGGGGTGIPPATKAGPDAYSNQLYDMMLKGIQDSMAGKFVPYGPDAINAIKSGLFQSSTGRAAAGKQALGQDLVRRGISRSGIAVEQNAAIDRSAASDYTGGVRDVLIKAAEANYQAKVNALQEARQIATLRQQYDLANARNELERNIANQNAQLAYFRIEQERKNLEAQLEAAYRLAVLNNGAALEQLLISQGVTMPQLPV